jgi:hypothetical protein
LYSFCRGDGRDRPCRTSAILPMFRRNRPTSTASQEIPGARTAPVAAAIHPNLSPGSYVRISAAPKLTTKGGGERSIVRSPPCLSLSGPGPLPSRPRSTPIPGRHRHEGQDQGQSRQRRLGHLTSDVKTAGCGRSCDRRRDCHRRSPSRSPRGPDSPKPREPRS